MDFKPLIKEIFPPLVFRLVREYFGFWKGNYPDWNTALKNTTGYDSDLILMKVRDALLKVKNGEAIFERDSVLFDHIEYSWPLLSVLLWSSSLNKGKLDLVDFGGSLGSTYFQNRKFISTLKDVHWNIIEQKEFVKVGRKDFESNQLRFYENIKDCLRENKPSLLLLNSTMSYLEEPYALLKELLKHDFELVFIDRTLFFKDADKKDRISIQTVPESIYKASYPCWIFNKPKLTAFFNLAGYGLVENFTMPDVAGLNLNFEGLIFKKL